MLGEGRMLRHSCSPSPRIGRGGWGVRAGLPTHNGMTLLSPEGKVVMEEEPEERRPTP
jgi:hypothetical protein